MTFGGIPAPSLTQIQTDFAAAVEPFRARFKILTERQTSQRLLICATCQDFKNGGAIYCENPYRSCRKLIPFIAQECPRNLWPAV